MKNWTTIILLAVIGLTSCSRKTTGVISTTTKVDSSSVIELRTKNEVLKDSVYMLKTKLTTITKQLATTLTGETGINDTASRLPMQDRTLQVGSNLITVRGRWEYLNYTVKIGETVSTDTYESDSAQFYLEKTLILNDSIHTLLDRFNSKEVTTTITKEPGFFERLWIGLKMWWWLFIACFILGGVVVWYLKR